MPDRLFATERTPAETARARAANRAAQGALVLAFPDLPAPDPELPYCHACGAPTPDRCGCPAAGVTAIPLPLEDPS